MVTALNLSTREEPLQDSSSLKHAPPADLSTYWMPLEPLAQEWATFGHAAATCAALGAVGMAFTALSWEAAALRHAVRAVQVAHDELQPERSSPARLSSHDVAQTLEDLGEARRCWQSAVSWLEQLAHHEPLEPAQRERAQQCLEQALVQVQRLWALMSEVQETQVVPLSRVAGRMAS